MKKIAIYFFSFLIGITGLQAQNWVQIGQDIDGESQGEQAGYSVALNSDGTVMAMVINHTNGASRSRVKVFQNNNGIWTQLGQDIYGTTDSGSGFSVDLNSDGTILAVGFPNSSYYGTFKGVVRLYDYDTNSNSWIQSGLDIQGENDMDHFGYSVSLSADGSVVAVGAIYNSDNGYWSGHVRVYKHFSSGWGQIGQDIDGEAAYDRFGYSVSLNADGTKVAVGAPMNGDGGTNAGQVKVFEINNNNWVQVGQDIVGIAALEQAGFSVELNADGSIVAVGAPFNGSPSAGQIRIYIDNNGTWTQLGQSIDAEAVDDQFGYSVSLSSDGLTVAASAINNSASQSNAGQVRVFNYSSGSWSQLGQNIDGEDFNDHSGWSICLSSDASTIAIGAIHNDGNGDNAGHVRVYGYDTSGVSEIEKSGIVVYPNPSTGIFNIKNPEAYDIIITDITGKIIFQSEQTVNEQVRLTRNGVYIINFKSDTKSFSSKIIVK